MEMVTFGDGRRLVYEVSGETSGEPVLFQPGNRRLAAGSAADGANGPRSSASAVDG